MTLTKATMSSNLWGKINLFFSNLTQLFLPKTSAIVYFMTRPLETRPNEFGYMTARKDDRSQIKLIFCHKGPLKAIKRHKRP